MITIIVIFKEYEEDCCYLLGCIFKTLSVDRCKPWTILHRHSVRSGTAMRTLQWPSPHKRWTSLVPTAGAHVAGGCAGTVPGGVLPYGSWRHVSWSSDHQHNFTIQVWTSLQKKEQFLFQPHTGPGVKSACNRKEYYDGSERSGGGEWGRKGKSAVGA
jgi:hypothetical protein